MDPEISALIGPRARRINLPGTLISAPSGMGHRRMVTMSHAASA